MKWPFSRRTEGVKICIAHAASFRKSLIKGFLSCQESKHRNANKNPSKCSAIYWCWFLVGFAEFHRHSQRSWGQGAGQWLSRLRTRGRRWDTTIVYYEINKHDWLPPPFTSTWPSLRTLLKWKRLVLGLNGTFSQCYLMRVTWKSSVWGTWIHFCSLQKRLSIVLEPLWLSEVALPS